MAESFAGDLKNEDIDVTIENLKCEQEDDKAKCTYCCNDKGEDESLNMRKVDGEWLVSISKDDIEK